MSLDGRYFSLLTMPQITRINYPQNFAGRQQKMCYVEFGDEEAMKAGLARQGEVRSDLPSSVSGL